MFGRQGRYGLSNRHISHVRYASLRRDRPRLFVLAVIAMGVVLFYKGKLKKSTISVDDDKQADSMDKALGQRANLSVQNKVNGIPLNRISEANSPTASPRKDLVPANELEWSLAPLWNCEKSSPFLIILIASHVSNQETRDVIRNSWCRRKTFPEGRSVACVFLLGESEDEELHSQVTEESQSNGDILKGSFPDNFRNSSRKLLMGLSWIERVCADAKFVMKTEDDVIVNTKLAITKLSKIQAGNTFMGKCWSDEPNRNPKSRFYVSVDAYPQVGYPEYCSGAGYIMSGGIARRLLVASSTQTILPFDEVFAGVLLEKIGVTPANVPGFLLGRFDESTPCRSVSSAVAIHVHGMDMKHVWSLLKNCNGGVR